MSETENEQNTNDYAPEPNTVAESELETDLGTGIIREDDQNEFSLDQDIEVNLLNKNSMTMADPINAQAAIESSVRLQEQEQDQESYPTSPEFTPDELLIHPQPDSSASVDTNNTQPTNEPTVRRATILKGLCCQDFDFLTILGQGAYGQVHLVEYKKTQQKFALKVVEKDKVFRYDKIDNVFRERDISSDLSGHPNIVKFEATFQDETNLYFILEYAENGSLAGLLKQFKILPPALSQYYAAEIVSALELMNKKEYVHRDLKPENILLDGKMHCKVTDFGESKKMDDEDELNEPNPLECSQASFTDDRNSLFEDSFAMAERQPKRTFAGSPLYISPEMLNETRTGFSNDMWALGCIIYQMLVGTVPFNGNNENEVFAKITRREVEFDNNLDNAAVDIIDRLLTLQPELRLGAGPTDDQETCFEALKQHAYFKGINFNLLSQTSPPLPHERYKQYMGVEPKYTRMPFEEFIKLGNVDNDDLEMIAKQMFGKRESTNQLDSQNTQQPLQSKLESQNTAQNQNSQVQSKDEKNQDEELLKDKKNEIYFESVVKLKKSFPNKDLCYNLKLITEPHPRLWLTSTLQSDNKENIYKFDILVYPNLKIILQKKDTFDIFCPNSKEKYSFITTSAEKWAKELNQIIIRARANQESFDNFLD